MIYYNIFNYINKINLIDTLTIHANQLWDQNEPYHFKENKLWIQSIIDRLEMLSS